MNVPGPVESLISDRPLVAHLATSQSDRPHVAPVWYAYDEGVVEVLSTGTKVENARANPRVALSIQQDDEGRAEWFVTLRGTATVTSDVEAVNAAARRIYPTYLGADPSQWDSFFRDHLGDDPENDLVTVDVGSVSYDVF
jgi:nitroimidazol reductase NimA-like FMN-containing flavoprotein (pyridoxamine 5'-phosphate oxidase superfamily)